MLMMDMPFRVQSSRRNKGLMDSSVVLQIVFMVVLLCLSAFFSAAETAFSSLNHTRLKSMVLNGNKRAKRTLALYERYDELLSTVLVGNNIINIALASIGTVVFVGWIGGAGVPVSTAVITLFVLVFGEVSPKSLAKEAPESIAIAFTPILHGLMIVLKPINWLFSKWKQLLSRMVSIKDAQKLTQDELLTLVREAEKSGDMALDESTLVKSALEFSDVDVSDILTPRVNVDGIDISSTQQDVADAFDETGYSRLIIYKETLDHIVGVLHQKDFYAGIRKGNFSLEKALKKPAYVPETAMISDLLKLLQKTQSQLAIVSDDYGGTVGIVTMEDILEELVGEIWDEHDEIELPFQKMDDNTYHVLGSADAEEMLELLGFTSTTDMTTVGGWAMTQAGKVPKVGDTFTCENWDCMVLRGDRRHVLEIEMKRKHEPKSTQL